MIRARIDAGELAPGERVPSTRGIVAEFGVAMATASKALAALRRDGVVRVVPGVGTVVAGSGAPAPSRARREAAEPELGAAAIVRAAIRIADAEGIDALSMRRVAASLGAGAMSLYRHVPGKDELMLLMRDAVFAEFPLPASVPASWRAALELTARAQWRLYRRHPWLARTTSLTRPYAGPNQMPYSEWNLRVLGELGLDDGTVFLSHLSLFSYVHGSAASLEAESREEADTGLTGVQWLEQREDGHAVGARIRRVPRVGARLRRPGPAVRPRPALRVRSRPAPRRHRAARRSLRWIREPACGMWSPATSRPWSCACCCA